MNWKIALLVPGAIALSFAVAPALPGISAPAGTTIAQAQNRGAKLNLSADQKAKLKQIRESTQSRISAILTPEQRQQLETLKQQRQTQRQSGQPGAGRQKGDRAMAALNLSDDQKAQISAIRQQAKQEMDAVLTPEQRQQMNDRQQFRKQRPANPGT